MSRILAASLFAAALAAVANAQNDRVVLTSGRVLDGGRVTSFDVRTLRYNKGGSDDTVSTDEVGEVELGKFKSTFARGLRDPDMMLTLAREQLEQKEILLAQMGFIGASARYFDSGRPAEAVSALGELEKALPECGVLPDIYRQKFEYYMSQGNKGLDAAQKIAKRYENDAVGGAWPNGFAVEAAFFQVISESLSPTDYQAKLRSIVGRASGANPMIAARANVELAHSLRRTKDLAGARQLYEEVLSRDSADKNARAGAYLGLGQVLFDEAGGDKEQFKKALLMFLRVRLETKDSWPSLQAEALYRAVQAADKWRGPEFQYVMGRCRGILLSEYRNSEWAENMRAGR